MKTGHAVALILLCFALGCAGSPTEGDSCSQENTATCEKDNKSQLVCEGGRLKSYPCPGPAGCTSNGSSVVCDNSNATAGQLCPRSNEGRATCTSADPRVQLTCTNGVLVSRTCTTRCVETGGQVACQ